MTRAQFEQLTKDLTQATRQPLMQALNDCELEAKSLEKVVLVGGSTRMPAIHRVIQQVFPSVGWKRHHNRLLRQAIQQMPAIFDWNSRWICFIQDERQEN